MNKKTIFIIFIWTIIPSIASVFIIFTLLIIESKPSNDNIYENDYKVEEYFYNDLCRDVYVKNQYREMDELSYMCIDKTGWYILQPLSMGFSEYMDTNEAKEAIDELRSLAMDRGIYKREFDMHILK